MALLPSVKFPPKYVLKSKEPLLSNLLIKTSFVPLNVVFKAFFVGKLGEIVHPVT